MRTLLINLTLIAATLLSLPASAENKGTQSESKGAQPALTAQEAFVNLPLPVLEIINRSSRLDMLDYYAVDSIHPVPNAMGGLSALVRVTPTYLKVRITPVSTLQIKLLPYRDSQIIATSYTVGDSIQAKDSEINFFDTAFNRLDTSRFYQAPEIDDFAGASKQKASRDARKALQEIPFLPMELRFFPDKGAMRVYLTADKTLTEEELKKVGNLLSTPLNYIWDGKKFKKIN